MQNFKFEYDSENIGRLTMSHKQRTKDADVMSITDSKEKELLEVKIPFDTKSANAMKIIFDKDNIAFFLTNERKEKLCDEVKETYDYEKIIDALTEQVLLKDPEYKKSTTVAGKVLPKITDLSNTKIWIGNDPELSEKIQKRAFELGWIWFPGTITSDIVSIYFSYGGNMGASTQEDKAGFDKNIFTKIFPEQILEDCFIEKTIVNNPDKWEVVGVEFLSGKIIKAKRLEDNKVFVFDEERQVFWEENLQGEVGNNGGIGTDGIDTKPKTYILQKDLPYCKAGVVWTKANDYDHYNFDGGSLWNAIPTENIEKMTEWFKKEEAEELRSINFTKEELSAVKTDIQHILRHVNLSTKDTLIRGAIISKIEKR